MAKIPRFLQRIFGSSLESNPTEGLAQFGSLAQGAPNYSADPSTIQSLAAWAAGWVGAFIPGSRQSPTYEDFNGLLYVITKQLAYITQAGVPEYHSGETYYTGSIVQSGGNLYRSLQDNNIGQSVGNTTYWANIVPASPVIPAQVNSDWNSTSGVSQILNKPTLPNSNSLARAWVCFDGTSGAILNSYNVQSVSRTGSGRYLINWTPGTFTNDNYAWSGSCGDANGGSTGGGNNYLAGKDDGISSTKTTSQLRVCSVKSSDDSEDCQRVCVIAFGT